jgi:Bacterial SH3 domain
VKLPKLETLILGVFLACILLWASSKCMSKNSLARRPYTDVRDERDEPEERPVRRDTVFVPQPSAAPSNVMPQIGQPAPAPTTYTTPPTTPPTAAPGKTPVATTPVGTTPTPVGTTPAKTPATTAAKPTSSEKTSILYVTIDGLKMRKKPLLNSPVVAKLELYEAVTFLNQKSEKQQEINLGEETVTDYWVKIRNSDGKEGWVFGAGVHYYKMRRDGGR